MCTSSSMYADIGKHSPLNTHIHMLEREEQQNCHEWSEDFLSHGHREECSRNPLESVKGSKANGTALPSLGSIPDSLLRKLMCAIL